eukprot:scaffold10237_cov79-Isochrysis_galbana.AAC.1
MRTRWAQKRRGRVQSERGGDGALGVQTEAGKGAGVPLGIANCDRNRRNGVGIQQESPKDESGGGARFGLTRVPWGSCTQTNRPGVVQRLAPSTATPAPCRCSPFPSQLEYPARPPLPNSNPRPPAAIHHPTLFRLLVVTTPFPHHTAHLLPSPGAHQVGWLARIGGGRIERMHQELVQQHARLGRAMLRRRTELKAHGSVPLCPPGVPPRERLQQLRGAEDLLARAAVGKLVLTGEDLRAERQGLEREIAEVDALMEGCPGGPRAESAARAARAQLERCRGTLYLLAHLRLIAGDAPLLGGGRAGRSSLYGPRAGLGGGLFRRNSGRCGMLKAPKLSLLERYQSAFGAAVEMQHTGEGRMPVPRLSMASRRVLSWRARAEQ